MAQTSKRNSTPLIDLKTCMGYSLMAYRANCESYISKATYYVGKEVNGRLVYPNSELVLNFIEAKTSISIEDQAMSNNMAEHFAGYLFNHIMASHGNDKSKARDEFRARILEVTSLEHVSKKDVGIVAYLAKAYFSDIKSEYKQARIEATPHTSDPEPLGSVGSRVTLLGKMIDCRHYSMYNQYKHLAECSGQLVEFWHKDPLGTELNIKAKVKHYSSQYNRVIAVLHYVKPIKAKVASI